MIQWADKTDRCQVECRD